MRLAGLADDVLAAQPLPPSGRKAGAQARSGAMPSHLDPETATTLAQRPGPKLASACGFNLSLVWPRNI
ncbi:hypothetical protein V6L77_22880 [Pannonibacter sp. Pt2-lr]